jgi:hypothetical protein
MSDKLTEQEALDRLKALGIDPGQWGEMGGHGPQTPQFALRLATNLKKVNELLEGAVAQKQAEVRSLEEKLLRLRFGGGS